MQSGRAFNKASFVNALELSKSFKRPRLYIPGQETNSVPQIFTSPATVKVENISCIEPFFRFLEAGRNPLMLDMASETTPGGGVMNGSSAQEEFLCYISNLYLGLQQASESNLYPIKRPFIVERVTFFKREPSPKSATCMNNVYTGAVIVCAALRLSPNSSFTDLQRDETRHRIKSLFDLAIERGYKDLVLSALGCGAFHNSPEAVATIFRELLIQEKYAFRFENIIFAILDDKNSKGNYNTFLQILNDCTN